MDTLINRVANSGLLTINLEHYFPKEEIIIFDIKPYLFKEMILKEKDFRKELKEKDWTEYTEKIVIIDCSADAIIPMWAYMLIASYLRNYAVEVFAGDKDSYLKHYYHRYIDTMDIAPYQDSRVIIKGCGKLPVPHTAYASITARLSDVAQSVMYGEPCSTVPIFKRPRKLS